MKNYAVSAAFEGLDQVSSVMQEFSKRIATSVSQIDSVFSKAGGGVSHFSDRAENFFSQVSSSALKSRDVVETLLSTSVDNFSSVATKFFEEQGSVIATVGDKLTATGGIAGVAGHEISKLASSLQSKATFGAEAILQGVSSLASSLQSKATFGAEAILQGVSSQIRSFANITGEIFKKPHMAALNAMTSLKDIGASGIREISNLASSLQSKATLGVEAILQEASSQLLSFANITGEVFEKPRMAVLNAMASLKGVGVSEKDLQSLTSQLGEALDSSIEGLSALSQVGVDFLKESEAQIKNLWSAVKIDTAQDLIPAVLGEQYEGIVSALGETFSGASEALQNSLGNVMEQPGKVLSPLRDKLAGFSQGLLPVVSGVFDLFGKGKTPSDRASGGGKNELATEKTKIQLAPSQDPAVSFQFPGKEIAFAGRLDIAGAPEGSSISSSTTGAPPVSMNLLSKGGC